MQPVGTAAGTSAQAAPAASRRLASTTDLRLQVLCKVLFTVYGSRFAAAADQQRAQQLIAEYMEVDEQDLIRNWDTSIECSIPSTLRIGAVFLGKGDDWLRCQPKHNMSPYRQNTAISCTSHGWQEP